MSSDGADEPRPQDPETSDGEDAAADAAGAAADDEDRQVMGLLSEHVPLSLIVDLSSPEGPSSEEIFETEGVPADSWWVPDGDDDLGSVGKDLGEGDRSGDDDEDAPQE